MLVVFHWILKAWYRYMQRLRAFCAISEFHAPKVCAGLCVLNLCSFSAKTLSFTSHFFLQYDLCSNILYCTGQRGIRWLHLDSFFFSGDETLWVNFKVSSKKHSAQRSTSRETLFYYVLFEMQKKKKMMESDSESLCCQQEKHGAWSWQLPDTIKGLKPASWPLFQCAFSRQIV